MSLVIYHNRKDVPCEIQDINDSYFNVFTVLQDTPLTREILWDIDKSKYANSDGFYPKFGGGTIRREFLSTGAKTLLNIASHPDVCFNVLECGKNALKKLMTFDKGIILWEKFSLVGLVGPCDILINNHHFLDLADFRRYVRENLK